MGGGQRRRRALPIGNVSPKEWWRTFVEGHNNYNRRAHRHLRSTGSE